MEFLFFVSPRTGLDEAVRLAQRLCSNLADSRLRTGEASVAVTGSFGVTRFVLGEHLDSCLKRTDDALYAAKEPGRNRVVAIPAT